MKNKKINFIFIIISLILILGSINLNINTVSYAKDRIIETINNEPIILSDKTIEEPTEETMIEGETEGIVVEESNSYTLSELVIVIISSIIVIVCLLNLFITKFGTISLSESLCTNKRLIYYSIILVTLCTIIPIYNIKQTDNKILNGLETKSRNNKSVALIEITENKELSSIKEESTKKDTSVIQVSNQAEYKATDLNILKSSGETSDKDSSTYYGLNSAVIIKEGSNSSIKDSIIVTGVDYSTGIFANGYNTSVDLNNVRLTTIKNNSNGIVTSESAKMNALEVEIKTQGNNSPSVNALSNESEITIQDSSIETFGEDSPLINNNGKITATKIKGIANNGNILTMNSLNSITITESNLITKLNNQNIEQAALYIYTEINKYDRMNYSNSSVTIEDSVIGIDKTSPAYQTSPLFHLTNIDANVNISNTDLLFGSKILMKVTGNDIYGEKGDNGGKVNFTTTDQTLKGNIIVDELSSISINLNNTYYKGQINGDNQSKDVNIILDKTTKWELTGDSYLKTLTIHNGRISRLNSQIKSNGYNIYYNAYQNDWLEGKTIRLSGGGKLIPVYES